MKKMSEFKMRTINGGATKLCVNCGKKFSGLGSNLAFILHQYTCW